MSAATFASWGWPASFASAFAASSRARCAAPIRREIEMAKAHPAGLCELGVVLFEPAPELRRVRLARGGHVLGEELQLLRHAALDDGVVLVEPHRQRLAVENLFLHFVFHQAARAPAASARAATATGTASPVGRDRREIAESASMTAPPPRAGCT